MVEPLTILCLVLAAGTAAAVIFWPHIADFFSTVLIPWTRTNLSNELADGIADLFCWLDDRVCFVRTKVKEMWATFRRVFLGGEVRVRKLSATEALETQTAYLQNEDGTVTRRVQERTVGWETLPPKIKQAMIHQNVNEAKMDLKETVHEYAQGKADQEGMELVLEL